MDTFLTSVYSVVHAIPAGQVATYGQIAMLAGYPGYARHVGKALGGIPESSTLPWFRVINSQGKISLTGPDYHRQREKLTAEGVLFSKSERVSLKQYQWQP